METNSIAAILSKSALTEAHSPAEVRSLMKVIDSRLMESVGQHMLKSSDQTHGLIIWVPPKTGGISWKPKPLNLQDVVAYFENNPTYKSCGSHIYDLCGKSEDDKLAIIASRIKQKFSDMPEDKVINKTLDMKSWRELSEKFLDGWLEEIAVM